MAVTEFFATTNSHSYGLWNRLSRGFARWQRQRQELALLGKLSDRDLADLGYSRHQLEHAVRESLFRAE